VDHDDLVSRYTAQLDELRDELARLQRERDDLLLLAENDKQRVSMCGRNGMRERWEIK